MLLKVDFSKEWCRYLYGQLYDRVLKFALECGDTEAFVRGRFSALTAGDPSVTLLVSVDEGSITAHCLFTLNQLPNGTFNIFVEQIKADSKHDEAFVKDCIAFGESIANVSQICMVTEESKYRAFRKKYNFDVQKVLMTRTVTRNE